jgi:hypothetical protein
MDDLWRAYRLAQIRIDRRRLADLIVDAERRGAASGELLGLRTRAWRLWQESKTLDP